MWENSNFVYRSIVMSHVLFTSSGGRGGRERERNCFMLYYVMDLFDFEN